MGQGYSFFAVIVFVVSGFVPTWLKKMYITGIFSFKTPFLSCKLMPQCIWLHTGKLMPQCILLNTGKLMPQCILLDTGKLMPQCIC